MRPVYRMKEQSEVTPELLEEIETEVESTIQSLAGYLEGFMPETQGGRLSKTSVVGPVGKLLSAVSSARLEARDALIGYVVNIHENTSRTRLTDRGRKELETGVDKLLSLKKKAPKRMFTKSLREIDYGVYKKKLEYILTKWEEKRRAENSDSEEPEREMEEEMEE